MYRIKEKILFSLVNNKIQSLKDPNIRRYTGKVIHR